jgi:hypothetical protein
MPGVMAPPKRVPSRPLMLAAAAPLRPPRGLMSVDRQEFAEVDLHLELRRLLWSGVAVLLLLLYLLAAGGR